MSAVFDEVTIKERLVVEGGDSGQVLSQFGGPVTFEGKVKADQQIKITNELDSKSTNSGALVVAGGVGIGKTVNIGGALTLLVMLLLLVIPHLEMQLMILLL